MNSTILVLGGGTAGWMSANLLHHALAKHGFTITLVESPEIGIIGVGEGSTPHLKQFFNTLKIGEHEWMPKCQATYKNGISFLNWSPHSEFHQYFHPFPSMPDKQTAGGFLINSMLRRQGHNVNTQPDQFFLSAFLAKHHLSPMTQPQFPLSINYGYHFDSGLLGEYLRDLAISKGVNHIQANVVAVETHLSGDISCVVTEEAKLDGDFFVDCSGFKSALLQRHLGVKFIDYSENLFNDAAVAIPSSQQQPIGAQTKSTALTHGWQWEIPLTNRTGNGYVYSNRYLSSDDAETELRTKLGLLESDISAKHLKMKVGRAEQHWVKNCLAVGLSQGFIEPLEATALHLVQETIENFVSAFEAGNFSNQHQAEFNALINARFEGIRDYIVCHYKVNTRTDSQYWIDNRNNKNISDTLQQIISCWDTGDDLTKTLDELRVSHFYPAISWHCLLSGYGRFPKIEPKGPPSHHVNLSEVSHYIEKCAKGFIPQDIALAHLQRV